MRILIFFSIIFLSSTSFAQTDTTKWLRAFPITDYLVDLNDSTKLVQVQMPDAYKLKEKQLGLIWGVYDKSKEETVQKGYGRCYLIKGDYYYFAIGNNNSRLEIKNGDLLYTFIDKTDIHFGQIPKLASHFIRLLNVYEEPYFDRYHVFSNWNEQDEIKVIDSMVADIRFTGNYFMENNPSMDVLIKEGIFKGKKTFRVMTDFTTSILKDFLDYIIARPRLYAGREWKVSEIFATWVSESAPTVVKE